MYLTVLSGKFAGKRISINKPKFVIGRGSHCDLRLNSNRVSRLHCEIVRDQNEVTVFDLGSSNGTYVNRKQLVNGSFLKNDDELSVGGLRFNVQLENNVEDKGNLLDSARDLLADGSDPTEVTYTRLATDNEIAQIREAMAMARKEREQKAAESATKVAPAPAPEAHRLLSGSEEELMNVIWDAINEYRSSHTGIGKHEITDALKMAIEAVRERV
ncbi:Hypothetical protein PBC10988_9880 [Planctomycetales bacterium 10988]|nr:Hypothetical protein PBC10988_9880 [Planctomycetales bacterium 10988]